MCQALRFILFVPKTYGLTCAVYVLEPKAWKLYYALKYMAQNPNTTMCFVFVIQIIDTTLFWVTLGQTMLTQQHVSIHSLMKSLTLHRCVDVCFFMASPTKSFYTLHANVGTTIVFNNCRRHLLSLQCFLIVDWTKMLTLQCVFSVVG